ncbi:MAG: response regulator [Phycisphaerales bacterium]|nr:response regulator [Phycisphaerales bacterium]
MTASHRPGSGRRLVTPGPAERSNTLGLTANSLDSLLDLLEATGHGKAGAHKREFVRWPFRQPSVVLQVIHPGGTAVTMRVACRNVSCGGAGLLHGAFVHPGSRCTLHLPRRSGEVVEVEGRIARCKHVARMIHELGVKFDAPIDVRQFMPEEATAEAFSRELVRPEELHGCVLLIDDATLQHQYIGHQLRDTRLRLRTARSVAEGIALAREGCEVIMTDYHLPDGTGTELIKGLREAGVTTPVIIHTCDDSPTTRAKAMRARPDGFLIKPVPQPRLLQAIAEFLGKASGGQPRSAAPGGALKEQMATELKAYGPKLREAAAAGDAMGCFVLCKQVRSEAPTVGMKALGERAGKVADSLSCTMRVADCREELDEIARLCEGAPKEPRAAA